MQFFAKKYLISLCLIISMLANVVAQEKKSSFTWFDRAETKLAGNISVSLIPQPAEGLYQLEFSVTWLNDEGKSITDLTKMPVLCLSKYDFDMLPAGKFSCTSFEQQKFFKLIFSATGKLTITVLNGYVGEAAFTARFQYAMTPELYDEGKSAPIDLMGTSSLKMYFQIKSRTPVVETAKGDPGKPAAGMVVNSASLRAAADRLQATRAKVKSAGEVKSAGDLASPAYFRDLEQLSARISTQISMLNPDSLPADTIQLYRDQYDRLNDMVIDLRAAYRYRISQPNLAEGDPSVSIRSNDSLRNLLRIRIEPVVHSQADSLNLIAERQHQIAQEISVLISNHNKYRSRNPKIDSLVICHDTIKKDFQSLILNHENTWNNYRIDIDGLIPVREIVSLHATFQKGQNDLQSAIEQVDNGVAAILPDATETPWYLSNRIVWTGLLVILVLVVVSTIWSSSRNRKILRERLTTFTQGYSDNRKPKFSDEGIFPSEVINEYYTIVYEESIPESVVGKVHYHASAIKSVYLLVQAALLERKGGDFGGYLFGNQYKLPGKSAGKSEIFIEKACDSIYLRSSISNNSISRADLIDELDELVRQNKKYRLIGWFTSCADNSMEIPEGLMKIHRSFFKEKWQIGILLNPGSQTIQGAGFLRRKTGYLDPMPDPAAFIKLEELYRFALNPASSAVNGQEGQVQKDKDYSRIALNNTWGDSIVTAVNFDKSVVSDITAAAAIQAIPKDTYQIVGYLYGTPVAQTNADGKPNEYEIFIDRFIELSNELTPRDLPGMMLLGWWGQANVDVMNYVQSAVDYHEQSFREVYQISCLVNPSTGELRIFTRKHSLEMNNSTIETEEYSLNNLLFR